MKEFVKNVLWCLSTMIVILIVTISLLMLGAALGEEIKPAPKEKVIECKPTSKGWSKCETSWI